MSTIPIEKTIPVVRAYTLKCRPVWTITWRDCVAPSIRSGVPDIREEDIYFNKQLAIDCIVEFGRKTLSQRLKHITTYLASEDCGEQLIYKVKAPSGYCHRVYTPEKHGLQHFLGLLTHEGRHNHRLKM